jgi:four helix bundle protein
MVPLPGPPSWCMQNFRRIDVWHRSHAFSLEVQRLVRKFPRPGNSDLRSQLVRAADSIPSNIVEGCGSASGREFARYLDISIKSAFEVEYRLQAARDSDLIDDWTWNSMTAEVIEIRKMLFGLRRTVLRAAKAEQEREEEAKRRDRRRRERTDAEDDRQKAEEDRRDTGD